MRRRIVVGIWSLLILSLAACSKDPEVAKREFVRQGDALVQAKKYPEAIIQYRNAIQIDPRLAEARTKLADAYVASGDRAKAYGEYIRAADLLPGDIQAQIRAGNVLLEVGKFEDAMARAQKVLAKDPKSIDGLLIKAYAFAGMRKLDDAVAEVQEAIRTDPERVDSYASLGKLQLVSGNPTDAEASFKRIVQMDPKSVPARLALGGIYWMTGRRPEAEEHFKSALALDPKSVVANRTIAYYYLTTGQASKAETYLVAVVDAAPDSRNKLALADYYAFMRRPSDVKRIIEDVVKSSAEGPALSASKLRLAALTMKTEGVGPAKKLVDEVLAKEPHNTDALVIKAEILTRERKLNDARTTIQAAVKGDPKSVAANFAVGRISELFGQNDEAIRAFTEVLKLNPGHSGATLELAKLHLSANRLDQAEQFALQAVRRPLAYVEAHMVLARINLMKGNVARAEPTIRALVKALPASSDVQSELGQLELTKGNRPAARIAFQRSIDKNPVQIDALAGLVAMDIQDRQPDAARARLKAAVAKTPENAQVLVLASQMHQSLGDLSESERLARAAIAADADNLEAYSVLAAVHAQQGRLDAAIDEYSKLAQRRDSAGVETLLGMLLERQKKPDLAAAKYQKALELDPRIAIAANNLASIRLEQGDLQTALELAKTAKAGLPDEPAVNDTLGWIFVKRGLSSMAIPPLRLSVEKNPKRALYHYHLGMAYLGTGDKTNARASLEKALQLDPSFPGAADALAKLRG